MVLLSNKNFNSTLVTLFSTKEKFEEEKLELNERQRFVFDYLKSNLSIRSMDIQKKFGVTRDTANRDLNELIKRQGIGKAVRYKLKCFASDESCLKPSL